MTFQKGVLLAVLVVLFASLTPSSAEDYYTTLGVSRDANLADLKKAYRTLSLKYHPDKNPGNVDEATRKFQAVSDAYGVLSDPAKRRVYDTVGIEGLKHAGKDWGEGSAEEFVDPFHLFKEFFGDSFSFSFSSSGQRGDERHQRARKAPPKPLFQPSDPVTILNRANFKAHLSRTARKATVWLAMFHDRDGESAALARTVKKVAAQMKGLARVGTIDCTQWPTVCAGQEADFLPSLRILSHNGSAYFKDTQDVHTIKQAMQDALPEWVMRFSNRRSQRSFEGLAANGTFDEGVAVLFSADTTPPPLLLAQAARFPLREAKRSEQGTSVAFHPRFALVTMPSSGRRNATQEGIASRFNFTQLPQLLMFRPALNTSRGLPLLSQHYTAGVLGRFEGELSDTKAVRKWVKGFAAEWTQLVVNSSQSVSNTTRDQLESAYANQRKEWIAIRNAAPEHTLMNATLDSFRSCFDRNRTEQIFKEQDTRGVKCLLVFSPTRAATAAVDAAAQLLKKALMEAHRIPRIQELQMLHVRGKPKKAAKWKSASIPLYLLSAMATLQAQDSKATVQPSLAAAAAAQLRAMHGVDPAVASTLADDGDLKDRVREASQGMLAAYSGEVLPAMRKGGKGAVTAGKQLPGLVLLEISSKGQWTACLQNAAGLVRDSDPQRTGTAVFGVVAPSDEPHIAAAKRISSFVTGCLQGSLPRRTIPGATADAILSLGRWREMQNNEVRQFLAKMAAKGAEK